MIIKVAFNKQIHLYKGQPDFSILKFHCANVFKMLPKYFQFYYFDSEQDKITVSSQHDLETLCQASQRQIKFFIQETDGEFQLLFSDEEDYQQIVEQRKLKKYDEGITTRNIICEKINQENEKVVKRISNQFILSLEEELVKKSLQEEEHMIKEEISKFITDELEIKVGNKIIEEEERIAMEQVERFMSKMTQECSKKLSKSHHLDLMISSNKEIPKVEEQINMMKSEKQYSLNKLKKNEILIEKMVDQKIKKLIPQLTKKIVFAVQAKLKINGFTKEPINCFKKSSRCGFYEC